MTDSYLDVHIDDDVAVLTLNRPAKLNVMDVATRVRLAQTIRRLGTGDLVRGIVLTGTGRAFSAGEDLQAAPTTYDEIREAFATFHDITRAILETKVPVIAAVNGIAVGGASEITLCCDSRIGTPAAEYYQPENHRGIIISNASSFLHGPPGTQPRDANSSGLPPDRRRRGPADRAARRDRGPGGTGATARSRWSRQWNSDPRTTALHLACCGRGPKTSRPRSPAKTTPPASRGSPAPSPKASRASGHRRTRRRRRPPGN